MWYFYNSTLSVLLDSNAPIKEKVFVERDLQPWIDDGILNAKRLRRKHERIWRHTKLTVHQLQYKDQCKVVQCLISKAKAEYYQNLINNCNGDQGKLFSIVNNLLGRCANVQLPQANQMQCLQVLSVTFLYKKLLNFVTTLKRWKEAFVQCPAPLCLIFHVQKHSCLALLLCLRVK